MAFELTSAALEHGKRIPRKYTCDGEDISPPLAWSGLPKGTKSLTLISDDPDTPGGWVHWLLYDIPPDASGLSEGVPAQAELADGSRHGTNGWGRQDYGGPCCPPGRTHHYSFRLYALDTTLDLPSGASEKQVMAAMEGHVLAQAELMGTYSR